MTGPLVVGEWVSWTVEGDGYYRRGGLGPIPEGTVLYGKVVRGEAGCASTGTPGVAWVREGHPEPWRAQAGMTYAVPVEDLSRGSWRPWTWVPAA